MSSRWSAVVRKVGFLLGCQNSKRCLLTMFEMESLIGALIKRTNRHAMSTTYALVTICILCCLCYNLVYVSLARPSAIILPSPAPSSVSDLFPLLYGPFEGRRRRFQKWAVAKWMEWPTDDRDDWPSNPGGEEGQQPVSFP